MSSHWKAILGLVLIFIFGFLSGIVCTSIIAQRKALAFYRHPAVAASAALEKRLTGNLGLDPNQKQQVHDYFAENLEHRRQLQSQIQPQIQMLNMATFQQINGVLRPDQLDRFHRNIEEFRKRWGQNARRSNDDRSPEPAPPGSPSTNSGAGTSPPAH